MASSDYLRAGLTQKFKCSFKGAFSCCLKSGWVDAGYLGWPLRCEYLSFGLDGC